MTPVLVMDPIMFHCGTCSGKGSAVVFAGGPLTKTCPACGSDSIRPVAENIAPKASPDHGERSKAALPPVIPGELKLQVFKRNADGHFEACGEFGLVEDNQVGPALLEQFGAGDFHVRWCHELDGILRSETIDLGPPEFCDHAELPPVSDVDNLSVERRRGPTLEEELLEMAALAKLLGQRQLERLNAPDPGLALLGRMANRLDELVELIKRPVEIHSYTPATPPATTTTPAPGQ